MRISRSANGARTQRQGEARGTLARLPSGRRDARNLAKLTGTNGARSAIDARDGDDLRPRPFGHPDSSTKRHAVSAFSVMPSACHTAGETSSPAFASNVFSGTESAPKTKAKVVLAARTDILPLGKADTESCRISTQRFLSSGARPGRYQGTSSRLGLQESVVLELAIRQRDIEWILFGREASRPSADRDRTGHRRRRNWQANPCPNSFACWR